MIPSRNSQRGVGHTRILVVATLLPFFLFLNISPGHAQAPAPAAGGGSYWICRAMPGDGSSYYSDIFAAPDSAYSDMAKGFTQFLAAKYNQKNGVPTCIHYVSDQQAQTYMKQFAAGAKSVLTGWKFGQTAAAPAQAAAPTPSQPPAQPAPPATAAAPAPAPAAQAPPASTTIAMRMVDLVNSATDPPGKQYRAVVTQAATAGSVSIPLNTEAKITLAQSGGSWSAQLSLLSLSGQWVPVTSSSVSASSPIQQVAQKAKSVFGINLGNVSPKAAVATAIATGDHVFLPVGAVLTFTASVPQPSAQASAGSTTPLPSASAPPAATAAAPVPANTASPASAAPQAAGEVSVLCEMTTPTHTYVSAIFSGDYKDKAKWEVAFPNYIYTNFDKFPGNGGCMTYPSATTNERTLQSWKSQPNSKILETGWVYKGPEPGPPAPKSNPNNGK